MKCVTKLPRRKPHQHSGDSFICPLRSAAAPPWAFAPSPLPPVWRARALACAPAHTCAFWGEFVPVWRESTPAPHRSDETRTKRKESEGGDEKERAAAGSCHLSGLFFCFFSHPLFDPHVTAPPAPPAHPLLALQPTCQQTRVCLHEQWPNMHFACVFKCAGKTDGERKTCHRPLNNYHY